MTTKELDITTTTLGTIAEIIMGQSPPGETCNEHGQGLPLLNGPTEFGPHFPTPIQFTTSPRKSSMPGDILFCVRGSTTGRMNWADQNYAIGRGVAAIRHKLGLDFQPFLRALIEYRLPDLLAQATGSTFPNVSYAQLLGLSCKITRESDQLAIAHILGTLDYKIELNRKMNETLEAMAQAIFKSWFVDFDPVRAKAEGRKLRGMDTDTTALFPDSFQDSPLGKIPRGWPIGKLNDLTALKKETINPGNFPNETFDHYSIPAFDENRIPKIELGDKIKSNKFILHTNSVLISKLNPRIPRIWFPEISKSRRSICSTEFLVILPKPPLTQEFLYAFLNSSSFLNIFASLITGTSGSHQRVKPDHFLKMEIVFPSQLVVNHFSKTVKPIYKKIQMNIKESQNLASIRDVFLPKLLSGDIRASKLPN